MEAPEIMGNLEEEREERRKKEKQFFTRIYAPLGIFKGFRERESEREEMAPL